MSEDEWFKARTAFLQKEKEFPRKRDELSRARRDLPWAKVQKEYVFDSARGKESLSDFFDGRTS